MNADSKLPLIDLEEDNNSTGRKQQVLQRERLSEGGSMYCVYWLHLEQHTDVSCEGYVGITKGLKERLRAHFKASRSSHLVNAIKLYGKDKIIVDVLKYNLSLEEALETERSFRPACNIGWNMQTGGELGVAPAWYSVPENADKHRSATATATRKGIAEKDTTESRSERAKLNWETNRDSYEGVSKGSKNPKAILTETQVHTIKYELFPKGLSNSEIATMYGVKHYVISFIRTGKNWSYV